MTLTNPLFKNTLILIKGAGDLASGVAFRLKRAGFPVITTELSAPLFVRRAVCYGNAIYQDTVTVEGITARRVDTIKEARLLAAGNVIPVLIDADDTATAALKPTVLVDAIMAKVNTGTHLDNAPLVIALGPGFTAGYDCHAVIETNRGHQLGRVIYKGQATPNTNTPGQVKGKSSQRVLRAPAVGYVTPAAKIGEKILQGQLIATVANNEIRAPFDGVLRGLVHPRVKVTPGFKIGDLDPRGIVEHCFQISEKALAIGGGVLEAILADSVVRT